MSIYQSVASLEEQGEAGALCTVVSTKGSVPRHQGSKMLVREDGRIEGSVGGGEMESRVIAEAMKALAEGKPRMLSYTMVDPTADQAWRTLEVYIEPILPNPLSSSRRPSRQKGCSSAVEMAESAQRWPTRVLQSRNRPWRG